MPKLNLLSLRNRLIVVTIEFMSHDSVTTKVESVTMALPKWHSVAPFAGGWMSCRNGNNAFGIITGFVLFFAGSDKIDDCVK